MAADRTARNIESANKSLQEVAKTLQGDIHALKTVAYYQELEISLAIVSALAQIAIAESLADIADVLRAPVLKS